MRLSKLLHKKGKKMEEEILSIITHNARDINNEMNQNNIIIEMEKKYKYTGAK